MGIEVVLDEIQKKGRTEVEETRRDTQTQVEAILSQGQQRARELEQGVEEELEKQVSHIINQEISAAHLTQKRLILSVQKELFEQVKGEALSRILALPDAFHRKALEKLLLQAQRDIPEGNVHCRRKDLPLVEEILSRRPELSGLHPGEPLAIDGGILVESRDGHLKIDSSYHVMLEKVWESGLKEVSDVLFR
jgi:V/A-type H+-transporting ATPase subunit E